MLADLSFRDLMDRFAAPAPTPGGGSAAALAGATGASLLAMVAGMPKTKTGTPEERARLDAARARLLDYSRMLVDQVDADAAAYEAVVAAYRLPKATDDEKAARKTAIDAAMQRATDAPLDTIEACVECLGQGDAVIACGNPSAVTDVSVGASLLMAGIQGGQLNVVANLDGLAEAARDAATSRVRGLLARAATAFIQIMRSETMASLHARMPHVPHAAPDAGTVPLSALATPAATMLGHLGTAEARQALEVLASSGDVHVATAARAALDRFTMRE